MVTTHSNTVPGLGRRLEAAHGASHSGDVIPAKDTTRWWPRSTWNITPLSAPQTRTALRTMASKTGCTSVREPLITRRISAVAVCRSSDSVSSALRASSSLNSRTFSMAITA